MVDFLKGSNFYFLPLDFGSRRMDFFKQKIEKLGGKVVGEWNGATHIIVEDSVGNDEKRCLAAVKNRGLSEGVPNEDGSKVVKYLKASWLSRCLGQNRLVDTNHYEIEWMKRTEGKKVENGNETTSEESSGAKGGKVFHEDFVCSASSGSDVRSYELAFEPNKVVVEELEKLANAYAVRNDKWRSHAYRKAINAVKRHRKRINTYQEAVNIPGVGEKMALKVMEIIECGRLGKVDEVVDDKTKILELFCNVWGAGPSTAENWYALGCRRLEDVEERGKPTRQQQIGLKYYEDLLEGIPREEVEEVFGVVEREALRINSTLKLELVGSFRRGKATCGDIDIMILNPGTKSSGEILIRLTGTLANKGYLTDDLVNLENSEMENHHKKYFGIFRLPGEKRLHRRLDLFVVPECERPVALVHYTGSALYNRNLKLWAAKKKMSLTEHGLYADTLRIGGQVTSKGQLIPTETEEDVFRALELPYKIPEERDH